jgi:uncharacterized membrane protein
MPITCPIADETNIQYFAVMIVRVFVFTASAIGLYISLYFTLIYYRIIEADLRLVPAWCRLDNNTCEAIVHTQQAHALGLPNSLYGIFYYLFVMSFVVFGAWYTSFSLGKAMVFFTAAPCLMSLYLIFALLYQLKTHCVLCYICHAINIILFLLFLLVIG